MPVLLFDFVIIFSCLSIELEYKGLGFFHLNLVVVPVGFMS